MTDHIVGFMAAPDGSKTRCGFCNEIVVMRQGDKYRYFACVECGKRPIREHTSHKTRGIRTTKVKTRDNLGRVVRVD